MVPAPKADIPKSGGSSNPPEIVKTVPSQSFSREKRSPVVSPVSDPKSSAFLKINNINFNRNQVHSLSGKNNNHMESPSQNDEFLITSDSSKINSVVSSPTEAHSFLNGNNSSNEMNYQLDIQVLDKETADLLISEMKKTVVALGLVYSDTKRTYEQNERIINQNDKIILQNEQILEKMSQETIGEANLDDTLYEPLNGFPINTLDQFIYLNEKEQKSLRKKLFQHLVALGGPRLRDFLNCAVKQTFTDELINQLSWDGKGAYQKLGDTRVCNTLYLAANQRIGVRARSNKLDFKTDIQEILRVTKQRFRKGLKKPTEPSAGGNNESDMQRLESENMDLDDDEEIDSEFSDEGDVESDA
ncbi:uncharacterized protein LOC127279890 [Leptopilina boulardi]|uniref:uncharacterized protein LOC127279890 n=1 Tax=Leptopilina boulardi TaxID=63433 RepID=UPI0021F54D59|nr:uncharacterized protein LOC127279890 [Leptopilina boulardi]XP_051158488.1 uncharacterized protein LOC127279890 [Leptopilina boulardi]